MKLIQAILFMIGQIVSMLSPTVNKFIKPVILFLQTLKAFIFNEFEMNEKTIRASLLQTLQNYYDHLEKWLEIFVEAVWDMIPEQFKKNVDRDNHIAVFIATVKWLKSIDNKALVYAIILNIASQMAILYIDDKEVRTVSIHTLIQNTYTHMKVRNQLPMVKEPILPKKGKK
ncbi:MAG: hypothetical protein GYA62_00445 [Bacteroidales bacterium]|nr:hypothetical protein [Bacteroidales bacterium]